MRDYNKEYQDNSRKYAYNFDSVLNKYKIKSILPFITDNTGKILEMGCYKGDFTEILTNYFDDITVIEASDELINFTKDRVNEKVKFIHSTFEKLDLAEKYDSIFFMHTLEHLDDPISVLKKVNTWLSDKGKLFLVVPNANAASRQIAVKMGLITHNSAVTEGEREHGHRKTYSLDTLENEALNGGLNIVHRGGIFFKPLANYQFDKLLGGDVITDEYLDGCYKLGMIYPDLCASIFLVCEKGINV